MLQIGGIFFALSQIALILILLAKAGKRRPAEWIFALLLACVASDLLLQLSASVPFFVHWWLSFFQTGVAGMFWLLCYALFDDHFKLKKWQLVAVFLLSALPLLGKIIDKLSVQPLPEFARVILSDVPQHAELVLLVHGISIVVRCWRVDLIPLRRSIGQSLVLFSGFFISVVISTRYIFQLDLPLMVDLQYLALALFLLYFNVQLLKWQPLSLFGGEILAVNRFTVHERHELQRGSTGALELEEGESWLGEAEQHQAANSPLLPEGPAVAASPPHAKEGSCSDGDECAPRVEELDQQHEIKNLVNELVCLMEEHKIYKEIGLTISEVARQMMMPEYRLRALINGELGYRNFNDFLGHYRIAEAAERLADPSEKQLPVLSIAIDVGYRSVSTFNKSFKDVYNLTPSEYRKQQLRERHRESK